MKNLKLSALEPYRNPKGWTEFWLGLIALIFITSFFGRIIYMEEMLKRGDAEIQMKAKSLSEEIALDEN